MSVAGEASEGAFKVNSLGNLENADAGGGRLAWDAPRSIWNMSFIAGALILGPLFFSWSGLLVFLVLVRRDIVRRPFRRLSQAPDPPQLRMSEMARARD